MFKYVAFFLLFSGTYVQAKTLKVAVIDTGLDIQDYRFQDILCPYGHRDFTGTGLKDTMGHGTHIVGTIKKYAKDSDYCLIIYKFYAEGIPDYKNLHNELEAMKAAIKDGAILINFSGGGSYSIQEEYKLIRDNPYIRFIVAAGNNDSNIDDYQHAFYPASYELSNVIPIGNLNEWGFRHFTSNYGSRVVWELGTNVVSTCLDDGYCSMSGTSMACSVHTGKVIYELSH